MINRRKFIKNGSLLAVSSPLLSCLWNPRQTLQETKPLQVHLFSKHLQFLDIPAAAKVAADIGFQGLDLTVRPKGHILPENVKTELPKAITAIKENGLTCDMITTAISYADSALDLEVIKTAATAGVKYYRSNWFRYKEDISFEESIYFFREKIQALSAINKENNIIGCYQNHSGTKVGASYWEVKAILKTAESDFFGAQYDIRHAVAEGGKSWPNGVKLLKDHIKTIVLKDFKWGQVDGKWKIINTPIGEGMVDFDAYFKLLKSLDLQPPVSLHLEYSLGGAEKGRSEINIEPVKVYDAMKNDLIRIQELWKKA